MYSTCISYKYNKRKQIRKCRGRRANVAHDSECSDQQRSDGENNKRQFPSFDQTNDYSNDERKARLDEAADAFSNSSLDLAHVTRTNNSSATPLAPLSIKKLRSSARH